MQLVLELTRACNYTCPFCYVKTACLQPIAADCLNRLRSLAVIKDLDVALSGGEPTLVSNLEEVVDVLRPVTKTLAVLTNGSQPLRVSQLDVDSVQVSLDGGPSAHDRLRGSKGAFDRCLETIDLCAAAGKRVTAQATISTLNYAELPVLFELLGAQPIAALRISAVAGGNFSLSIDQKRRLVNQICREAYKRPHTYPITTNLCHRKDALAYYGQIGRLAPTLWFADLSRGACRCIFPESRHVIGFPDEFLSPDLRWHCACKTASDAIACLGEEGDDIVTLDDSYGYLSESEQ